MPGLTSKQVETFWSEGFVAPLPALGPAEACGLRNWVETFERDHPHDRWAFNLKANLLFESVDRLVHDVRFLDPVEDLIGPNLLISTATFRIKEASSPGYYWLAPGRPVHPDGSLLGAGVSRHHRLHRRERLSGGAAGESSRALHGGGIRPLRPTQRPDPSTEHPQCRHEAGRAHGACRRRDGVVPLPCDAWLRRQPIPPIAESA